MFEVPNSLLISKKNIYIVSRQLKCALLPVIYYNVLYFKVLLNTSNDIKGGYIGKYW